MKINTTIIRKNSGRLPSTQNSYSFSEAPQNRANLMECLVDVLSKLGTGDHNLSANKNKQANTRLDHPVDKTRKELRFIAAKLSMRQMKTFQTDREHHVARTNHVLNLEIHKFDLKAQLLENASKLSAGQPKNKISHKPRIKELT